jgi:hypothetical protein
MEAQQADITEFNLGKELAISGEMSIAERTARETIAIQSQIVVAKRFPRNAEQAAANVLELCKDFEFADAATYIFPIVETIQGGSIHMALEVASAWGNMWNAVYVIYTDDERCKIEALAWDFETNQRMTAEDTFRWRTQKKIWSGPSGNRTSETVWIPCEDDWQRLRLLNNHASRILRNQIKRVIPHRYWSAFVERCLVTLEVKRRRGLKRQPKLADLEPKDVVRLRKIMQSLRDGYSVPGDWFGGASIEPLAKPATQGQPAGDGTTTPPADQKPASQPGVTGGGMGNRKPDPGKDDKKKKDEKLVVTPELKKARRAVASNTTALKKKNMGAGEYGTQELEARMLTIAEACKTGDQQTVNMALLWLKIAQERLDLRIEGENPISTKVTRRTNVLALLELVVLRSQFEGDLRAALDDVTDKAWAELAKLTYLQFRDVIADLDEQVVVAQPDWFTKVRFGEQITK